MGEIKEIDPKDEFEIGDTVKHPRWGVGTVLYKTGSGDQAKLIVIFPEEGQKKLMLKYAKLKKVKESKEEDESEEEDSED
jgi:DNA helicase-2/ATP-dependent DNA helicase PcrA